MATTICAAFEIVKFNVKQDDGAQVLKALGKRLESKKGHARLRFREQRPPQHLSASSERDTGLCLSDDEILLTVGILRYGHSNRLQVLLMAHPPTPATHGQSILPLRAIAQLLSVVPAALMAP